MDVLRWGINMMSCTSGTLVFNDKVIYMCMLWATWNLRGGGGGKVCM
jgi:hypothetical protein